MISHHGNHRKKIKPKSQVYPSPSSSIHSSHEIHFGLVEHLNLKVFWDEIDSPGLKKGFFLLIYLVVSTPLKNTSQNGNLPQVGVKIKNIWNNHLVCTSFFRGEFRIAIDLIYTKSSVTNKFNNLWLPRRFSREFFVCKKSGCTSVVCLNVWGWNWESWPWGSFCSDLRIYMM